MNEQSRWPNERLDDFAAMVDRRFRRVEEMPDRLLRLEGEVAGIRGEASECNENVKKLQAAFDARARERAQEREQRRVEHKSDRRYWMTTVVGAGGLVVAAVAVLAGKFG